MKQLFLLDVPPDSVALPSSQAPRRAVPETSRVAYALEQGQINGRKLKVLTWLKAYIHDNGRHPTSAELAALYRGGREWTDSVLYIRRGLSDLKKAAFVEPVPHGDRKCTITRHKCETWRVVGR